jgi:hypothetical protein
MCWRAAHCGANKTKAAKITLLISFTDFIAVFSAARIYVTGVTGRRR